MSLNHRMDLISFICIALFVVLILMNRGKRVKIK